jgi:hypothetical protein
LAITPQNIEFYDLLRIYRKRKLLHIALIYEDKYCLYLEELVAAAKEESHSESDVEVGEVHVFSLEP